MSTNVSDITIKARVLSYEPETQTYVVNFYTDVLKEDFERNKLPKLLQAEIASGRYDNAQQAEAWVRANWYPGEIRAITLFQTLRGQTLIDYIFDQAPQEFLEHREASMNKPAVDQSVLNRELVKVRQRGPRTMPVR